MVRFVQDFLNYYILTYLLPILLAECPEDIKHILWRETGFQLSLFVKMTVTYTNIFRPASSYCSVIFHMHKWIAFEVWATKVVPNHNSYGLAKQKALRMPTDQIIQISKEQRWKIKQKLQWPWGGCGCHTHTHTNSTVSLKKDINIYCNMTKNLDSQGIYRRGNKESHPKKLPTPPRYLKQYIKYTA